MIKYLLRDQLILIKKFNFLSIFHYGVRSYKKGLKIPIIIIKDFPGLWNNKDEISFFQEKGNPVYVMDFGLQLSSIKYYEEKLYKLTKQFKQYNLVGYSQGGIICLYHANKRGFKKINKLIAITSPLNGVAYSRFFKFIPTLR